MSKNTHNYRTRARRRLLLCAVAAILCRPSADVHGQAIITGTLRQLTTNPASQTDPAISGDIVTYTDGRNGNDDVYAMNVVTGVETPITTSTTPQRLHDVSGGLIVYTDLTPPAARIHTYDIATGTDTVVSAGPDQNARIDGSIVVFERGGSSATDIVAVDLATNTEITVASTSALEVKPSVSGTKVVYERRTSAGAPGDIVLFDLATQTETLLASGTNNRHPDIDGNTILWDTVTADGSLDVVVYDVTTAQTRVLAMPGNQRFPHISGHFMSFDDDSAGNPDVAVSDLTTGAMRRIGGAASDFLNDISGNRLVFTSNQSGNLDIWVYEFQVTGDTFYGVNSHDDGLSMIDVATGQVAFIGPLSADPNRFVTPVAMTARPSDRKLFAWNNSRIDRATGATIVTGELLTVDSCSARGTPVNASAGSQGLLGELAFAPDGTLYGFESELWRIDPATGIRSLVSPSYNAFGVRIAGADFMPDGRLYGVDLVCTGLNCPTEQHLYSIDVTTGLATYVATLSQDIGTIGAVVFNPATDKLLGSGLKAVQNGRTIFDLDPADGTVSNVRVLSSPFTVPGDPQGMGFAPPCVAAQAGAMLSFFDAAVAAGQLTGTGDGKSGNGRLTALRNMIRAARDLLLKGQIAETCTQLKDVLDRTDGNPDPPDFVTGPAADDLAAAVRSLRAALGCP